MCDVPIVGQIVLSVLIALAAAPFIGLWIALCMLMFRDIRYFLKHGGD